MKAIKLQRGNKFHHFWVSQYIKAIVLNQRKFEFEFWPIRKFPFFSPVLFHQPSCIIVQSDGFFSICHLEFLSNHRLICHLELLFNQMAAFHLPSCIFVQSEMTCPPAPLGIELSVLHYYQIIPLWYVWQNVLNFSSINWLNAHFDSEEISNKSFLPLLCTRIHLYRAWWKWKCSVNERFPKR